MEKPQACIKFAEVGLSLPAVNLGQLREMSEPEFDKAIELAKLQAKISVKQTEPKFINRLVTTTRS